MGKAMSVVIDFGREWCDCTAVVKTSEPVGCMDEWTTYTLSQWKFDCVCDGGIDTRTMQDCKWRRRG